MAWPGFPELGAGNGFDPRPVATGIGIFALVIGVLLSALAFIPGPHGAGGGAHRERDPS
jgi:hypothetical protein